MRIGKSTKDKVFQLDREIQKTVSAERFKVSSESLGRRVLKSTWNVLEGQVLPFHTEISHKLEKQWRQVSR